MEPNWVMHAGMAVAVGGFFAATWWAYRRPAARQRDRISPQLDTGAERPVSRAENDGRKAPLI